MEDWLADTLWDFTVVYDKTWTIAHAEVARKDGDTLTFGTEIVEYNGPTIHHALVAAALAVAGAKA